MIKIIISYVCTTKENRDRFYKRLREEKICEKSAAESGCAGYSYYFPADDETKLLLIEQWETQEALTAHQNMPHFIFMQQLKAEYNIETKVI